MNSKLSILFGISIALISNFSAQANPVKIATIDYAPFSSPDLPEGGFQTDIIRQAFKSVGRDTEFSFLPWKRAYKLTIDGQQDLVTSIFYTEARNKILHFSDPVYIGGVGFVALKSLGLKKYENLKDLQKYTIGVLAGAIFQDEFDSANYLDKHPVSSDESNVRKLFAKRVDLVATSLIYFQYNVSRMSGYSLDEIQILEPKLAERPVYVAVSRKIPNHAELVEAFNQGLALIRKQGRFMAIARKHGINHLTYEIADNVN